MGWRMNVANFVLSSTLIMVTFWIETFSQATFSRATFFSGEETALAQRISAGESLASERQRHDHALSGWGLRDS